MRTSSTAEMRSSHSILFEKPQGYRLQREMLTRAKEKLKAYVSDGTARNNLVQERVTANTTKHLRAAQQ
jgi:hypothetical protein